MTYRFTSRATGDLLMLHPDGDALLRIIGRKPAAQGIIEPPALAAAIAALEQAIAAEGARQRPARSASASGPDDDDEDAPPHDNEVSLRQRAWPLLKLLKAARAADTEVVWGH